MQSDNAARRLGSYLGCPKKAIESALARQGMHGGAGKRLGQLLLETRDISAGELQSGVRAQRLDRLRACPLFANLSDEELAKIVNGFEEISLLPGEQFVTQDAPEPYLYVLASGHLEVFRSNEEGESLSLSTLYPGEPIGEMGYFSNNIRSASVRALESCQLLRANYQALSECFEAAPEVARAFMDVVSSRLRRTNQLYQDNQYRLKHAERSLQHLNDFLDLSEAAELGAGIEGLIERLVKTASNITDAERATLFLIDARSGELWSKVAEGAEIKEIRVPAGAGIVGWVAEHKRMLNIPDAYQDERFNRAVDKHTGYRTRTILCAPMWSLRNEILGVVQVINKRSGIFNDDDEALLRAFAHQAAVAVENFNLYRKMMANHRKMAIMLDISVSLGHTLDLGSLIREIVRKTTEVLQCDRGSFFVVDEEADELWSMEARGSELKEIRFPMAAGLAGHVATTGEVLNIEDAYEDQRFNPDFDRKSGYRTRSVLCVPVFDRDGHLTGVTQAINKFDGAFSGEDIDLLRAIGSQIGVALDNAKLHASTVNMKNYLESVQQSISNAILTLDGDYRVITANNSAKRLFPRLVDKVALELDIRTLLGERNRPAIAVLQQVYESLRSASEYDIDLYGVAGPVATVNLNVQPLLDAENAFQGLVVVVEDITSEKRIKSAFSHYLAPAVIEQLLAEPDRLALGGEKRELTFLCTDIAGFTTLSERIEPGVLVRLLNEYFDRICDIVLHHGGTIDKIVGDALHVMFNAPTDQSDHAERAVQCALDLDVACQQFIAQQAGDGVALGDTRIGVNTGPAVVGNFGGTARFDYTAYGDSVNTASRLEGANKYLGTRICVSEASRAKCAALDFRPVGRLILKGKTEATEVFEPAQPGELPPSLRSDYERAYELLAAGDARARGAFESLAAHYPRDRLVAFHARRLAAGERGATIVMTGK